MASNESSLDINGSGGGNSSGSGGGVGGNGGGGSHSYLGSYSNDKPIRGLNVSPCDYDPMKPQPYNQIMEMQHMREQADFYRNQTLQLHSKIGVYQKKQRFECEFDHSKKFDINMHELIEQYNELKSKYSVGRGENDKLRKEMDTCKNLCDKLSRDLKTTALEKNDLWQQCNMLLEKGKKGQKIIDKSRIEKKELENLLKERELYLNQISSELNAHKHELKKIHSERDTVLKENQKFAEESVAAINVSKQLEKENKHLKYQNECLKQDINTAFSKCDSLTKKLDTIKSRPEFQAISNDSWNSDLSEMNDKYNEISKQHEQDLQAANQEIDKLKKALDKATSEVTKATQEIDEAKGRRDWAISSRERIVRERESIKTLCDELRKERDKAVSDLLAAFRDIEDIKKQKDEACKEVDQLKEQLESQTGGTSPTDNNTSKWSGNNGNLAVTSSYGDNDKSKRSTDIEKIEVDMNYFSSNEDLGLTLDDGRNEMQNMQSGNNMTVVGVAKDSIFCDKLQKNDVILQVNNLYCSNISKRFVLDKIRSSTNRCTLLVRRQKSIKTHYYKTQIPLDQNLNHGLTLQSGIYVSKIAPGSPASKDGNIAVGDRILSINERPMDTIQNSNDAMAMASLCNQMTLVGVKEISHVENMNLKPCVTNVSIQTDDYLNQSLDLEGNRHFVPTTNPYLDSTSSQFPPTTTPATSTSKISAIFHIFRGKINNKSNEADAIAALDSVLNNDMPSNIPPIKDGVLKRSKKKGKESKESSKSMGTWPRTNIIEHDNNTGTIVNHRPRKRPPLSTFIPIPTKSTLDPDLGGGDSGENYFGSTPLQNSGPKVMQPPIISSSSSKNMMGTVRDSSLLSNQKPSYHAPSPPPHFMNRHSICYLGNNETSGFSGSDSGPSTLNRMPRLRDYEHNHHDHRMSLNVTPESHQLIYGMKSANTILKKSQKNNSIDFEPIKSQQNSIESMLSASAATSKRQPMPMSMPISKDSFDFLQSRLLGKTPSKYPSDSESLGPDIIPQVIQSPHYPPSYPTKYPHQKSMGLFTQYPHVHTPSHPHPTRLHSPSTLPGSQTGDPSGLSIYGSSSDYVAPFHHTYGMSIDYPSERDDILSCFNNGYEGGTYPQIKEHNQRLRIPSNHSVTSKGSGVKNSTGSIEHHGSERGSPMPTFQVEILSHGSNSNKRNSMPDYIYGQKPNPGDLRRVTIDKSVEPLGITIRCNNNGGGIVVSTVTKNSIASQVGLQIGDQLLEICGINMRAATYESAWRVLRQCGNPITMLVQYSPEKYDGEIEQSSDDQSVSHSGSPTPQNSPTPPVRSLLMSSNSKQTSINAQMIQSQSGVGVGGGVGGGVSGIGGVVGTSGIGNMSVGIVGVGSNSGVTASGNGGGGVGGGITASTKGQNKDFHKTLVNDPDTLHSFNRNSIYEEKPRLLFIETKKSSNLGIRLVGGNAHGIFVDNVEKDSVAYNAGMKVGDQILEFNGSDLKRATAEHAAYELAKPADDKVKVIVQYNFKKFNQIKDLAGGDSFYIRVGFDRTGELGESELRFEKNEVLYVDNTFFSRTQWRAWKLDEFGHLLKCGIISSQLKVEEDLRHLGDISDGDATTRRGSTSARRSFFRRKKHQRSSSRDSKELASFSNTQLSWHSDSGMLSDEGTIQSYQRVERIDFPNRRPVLILGPLADWIVDKLHTDSPMEFKCCQPTPMNCDIDAIENMIMENIVVDYRRHGSTIEVTTVESIKEVCDKNVHCILDINLTAVERLHRVQIYPIVLLLRFKSAKQIKEIKDSRYASDKISAKAAKEMYEHSLKLLTDYKHLISAVISAGSAFPHICTQVKDAVEKEQKKIVWVSSSSG